MQQINCGVIMLKLQHNIKFYKSLSNIFLVITIMLLHPSFLIASLIEIQPEAGWFWSNLCKKQAEFDHPQIIAWLTKSLHKSKETKILRKICWHKFMEHINNIEQTTSTNNINNQDLWDNYIKSLVQNQTNLVNLVNMYNQPVEKKGKPMPWIILGVSIGLFIKQNKQQQDLQDRLENDQQINRLANQQLIERHNLSLTAELTKQNQETKVELIEKITEQQTRSDQLEKQLNEQRQASQSLAKALNCIKLAMQRQIAVNQQTATALEEVGLDAFCTASLHLTSQTTKPTVALRRQSSSITMGQAQQAIQTHGQSIT